MYAIFKKTLADFRWTFVWFAAISVGYVGLISSMYPTVRANAEQFVELMENYPKGIMEAFGVTAQSLTTYTGFLSVEYFSFMFVIILGIFTFMLGTSLVAGEVDRGTSEFTFTLPVKRYRVLAGKILASYALILGVIILVLAAVYVGGQLVDAAVSVRGLGVLLVALAAVAFLLLSVSAFFSSIFSRKGLANGASGGFLGVSYALMILNGMTDKAAGAYVFSFFKYYGSPERLLTSADMSLSSPLTLVLVGACIFVIGSLLTEERDL
ncbi:MAG TPA: ABC transporter permease subunit [Candidatus Paceibacterota bacterium]|nr:ABC transporter permease subunit [Candidatus Paceibacterota bacterium]